MLLVGIAGSRVTRHERAQLAAPQVSGVVLFARNFASRAQLAELVTELRTLRDDDAFVIAVDQEGGPVQRFRDGFTRLPALATLGGVWDRDRARALALAREHAWLMASELRAVGIDASFAPVLDLARGNRAIGNRALHAEPDVVATLGRAYVQGMHAAGMPCTLKHFPGHGSVAADTHRDAAIDPRALSDMRRQDWRPFAAAMAGGAEAVMMAHVLYPAVDTLPAGQSRRWIEQILRGELGFGGLVLSDDISMAAAAAVGGVAARIDAHRNAGCDLILACQPEVVDQALACTARMPACPSVRVRRLCGRPPASAADLPDRAQCVAHMKMLAGE